MHFPCTETPITHRLWWPSSCCGVLTQGVRPRWFTSQCLGFGTTIQVWLSISTLVCQQELKAKGFSTGGTETELLPHVVASSPSRNTVGCPIWLPAKSNYPTPDPSRFYTKAWTVNSLLAISGLLYHHLGSWPETIIAFPLRDAWAFQFIRLRAFSNHWPIATWVTISDILQHLYFVCIYTHTVHSYWWHLGLFRDIDTKVYGSQIKKTPSIFNKVILY